MTLTNVNFVAVLVAAILSMAVGFAWYSPMLFGKPWMKLMGIDPQKMKFDAKVQKMYAMSFVGSLVMAYALSMLVRLSYSDSLVEGLMTGFWAWLGFVAPVQMTDVLFGGKSWNLFYLNTGYQLASLLVMGGVLAVFG